MAKKPTISKAAELSVPTGLSVEGKIAKPAQKKTAKPKTIAKEGTAKPKGSRTSVKAKPVTEPSPAVQSITNADIALRAYYISEKRQKLGLPGDSAGDWIEAERQLKAEAAKK